METELKSIEEEVEQIKQQVGDLNIEIDELESECARLGSLEYTNLKKNDASYNKMSREIEGF